MRPVSKMSSDEQNLTTANIVFRESPQVDIQFSGPDCRTAIRLGTDQFQMDGHLQLPHQVAEKDDGPGCHADHEDMLIPVVGIQLLGDLGYGRLDFRLREECLHIVTHMRSFI